MNFNISIPITFILIFQLASGQFYSDFYNHTYFHQSIYLGTEFEAGSNALNNQLMNRMVWGGYIDKETKNESAKLLKNFNNLGLILNNKIGSYIKYKDKLDLLISVQNYEILNAGFNKDFYHLAFYGNKMFLGQTINLSHCGVNALRYQELKFGGLFKKVENEAKIGFSLSFIKGEQLLFLKLGKNNTFYQSSDGTEIQIGANFELAMSDTNNRKFWSFNGIGSAADFYFEKPYKSKIGKKSVLIVNANHIGFIFWRKNSIQFSSDSVISFKGYTVDNILDLKDSTLNKISTDSILRSITNARKETFNINLPGNLFLINKIFLDHNMNISWNLGFRYMFNAHFRPYVFQEIEYRRKKLIFLIHAGTGGYYFFNCGAGVSYTSKRFFMRIGSNSLQGFIAPKLPFGQNLYFIIAYKF
ncbi:MAG: hypothetical protein N3F09_09940 [Bacteroidia bacterium]|nr:hypothetical protein [Bacteroidia bacterium]